jgi:ubiquinone/menaquinone biosynthesis C-methylase UbiE
MLIDNVICPACKNLSNYLLNWEFSGLNDSIFNYTARFFDCPNCGLVFIENIDDERLSRFYTEECAYFENTHFDINSPANVEKYSYYRDVLSRHGLADTRVVDVGCGRGGFLIWLNNNGWLADCYGVDVDVKSVPASCEKNELGYSVFFNQGRALALPYESGTQQLLTYFHVLEHIKDIDSLLNEAYRVLKSGGHLVIEVPDAENYARHEIGTAFWVSIREHIYHFSSYSLVQILQRHGFEILTVEQKTLPTPEFRYPSLMIMAKKSGLRNSACVDPVYSIAPFFTLSKQELLKQADLVNVLAVNHSKLTFWGCSSELFSLLPKINSVNYDICDISEIKQRCEYKGNYIKNPLIVNTNGGLIVSSYLHTDSIEKAAIDLGWKKQFIFRINFNEH